MQPKFDDIIGYINTQITVLKARQERLLNTFDSSQNPEVEKLRMVIERKQMELMELHRRDIADRSLIARGVDDRSILVLQLKNRRSMHALTLTTIFKDSMHCHRLLFPVSLDY